MTEPDLAKRRILVVEDEFILAADICEQIEAHGGVVVGPAFTLARGQALFQTEPKPDGAILNIRIGDSMVYPLADDLIAAGVPIIFASSENKASIPETYVNVPIIGKPIKMMIVAEKLFPAHYETA